MAVIHNPRNAHHTAKRAFPVVRMPPHAHKLDGWRALAREQQSGKASVYVRTDPFSIKHVDTPNVLVVPHRKPSAFVPCKGQWLKWCGLTHKLTVRSLNVEVLMQKRKRGNSW